MVKETIQKPVSPAGISMTNSQGYSPMTPEIADRLNKLLDFTEPGALREHLLKIYHLYIIHEHESLPHNFKELANSMHLLLDFLKFAQEEMNGNGGAGPDRYRD